MDPSKRLMGRSIILEDIREQTSRTFLYWAQVQGLQFDTSPAALGHNALLPPDEIAKVATSASLNAGVTEGSSDENGAAGESDPATLTGTAERNAAFDEEAFYPCCKRINDLYHANAMRANNSGRVDPGMVKLFMFADKDFGSSAPRRYLDCLHWPVLKLRLVAG